MKYYIQYPISVDCFLNCPYCFFTEEKEREDLSAPNFSVEEYINWRKTNLNDAEEIRLHFQGGEPSTDRNISDIVNFLKKSDFERIDILSNGLGKEENYLKLKPFKDRFHRIGFTFHRKVIGDNLEQCARYENTVRMFKEWGFPVYVKELLFTEEKENILAYRQKWKNEGIPLIIQDFKGWEAGTDFTEFRNYTTDDFLLIDPEYLKEGNECYCLKGYKNIIIRGGWMAGDVIACWKDLTVIGNIKDNTYSRNYKIKLDYRYPDGIDVVVPHKVYRGTYPRDSRKLEKLRQEGSYTSLEQKGDIIVKLKNGLIFEQYFNDAFIRLFELSFESNISLQLVRSLKVIEQQRKNILEKRDSIAKKYAQLDSSGNIIIKDGLPVFETDEKRDKFSKEINDLSVEEFDIPLVNRIELPSGKITPADINILLSAGILSD